LRHEEFAELAEERLEAAADRLEGQARELGIDGEAAKISARAGERRVAALLVREEAVAVSRTEGCSDPSREDPAYAPPLRAQA
jgi:hypothetical protein